MDMDRQTKKQIYVKSENGIKVDVWTMLGRQSLYVHFISAVLSAWKTLLRNSSEKRLHSLDPHLLLITPFNKPRRLHL